jgi:hypothetical protein
MTDQALAALGMMDFTKKDEVMAKISENGTLLEMLIKYQQLALQYANALSPQLGEQVAQLIIMQDGGQVQMPMMGAVMPEEDLGAPKENAIVERARNNARSSTQAE